MAQAYVEAGTEPGDLVLIPYCQGAAEVGEVAVARRRALALHFDPVVSLAVRTRLSAGALVSARELDAAVARLGDGLKQGVPLRRYMAGLYASTCPACQRPAVADYFLWDRETQAPIAKQIHCPACSWNGQAAVDAEDRDRMGQVPARGMHYYYVLDRVAPQSQDPALRSRVESLLKLYSPRNLYALAELTLKVEGLFPAGLLHDVLKVLLLDCLEHCSSLEPPPGSASRRQSVSPPAHYLERNVWTAFEEALLRAHQAAGEIAPLVSGVGPLAPTPEALLAGDGPAQPGRGSAGGGGWAAYAGQGAVRDLRGAVPGQSVRLILFSPPPLDAAAWSLSYLWGAWLLGTEAAAPLRPLLRQRTPDVGWYANVMRGSLRLLAAMLRGDGRMVLVLTGQRPGIVEALLLAAGGAGLAVSSVVQSGSDYRLELVPAKAGGDAARPAAGPRAVSAGAAARTPPLERLIRQVALEAATDAIRQRGEPVPWLTLHAAIQWRLAEKGVLARVQGAEERVAWPLAMVAEQVRAALQDPSLVQLAGLPSLPAEEEGSLVAGDEDAGPWWLRPAAGLAPPLCDRVEMEALHLLAGSAGLIEADFFRALYERFPGILTPDPALVDTCLRALGYEAPAGGGVWRLRPEDLPVVREAERKRMVHSLATLGQRLGYRTGGWTPFDVAWSEGGQVQAAFAVREQAALGEVLPLSERAPGVRPYLVIPGGRSALVGYKLAHNPVWQDIVDQAGWRFIKYRQVRMLLAQPEVDEADLRAIVGLDPIVENEGIQLSLF